MRLGCLWLLLLALSWPAAASQPMARLRGRILDENGQAVAGATITLTSPAGQIHRLASDIAGRFQPPPLSPGRYQIQIAKQGFFRLRSEYTLHAGRQWPTFRLAHQQELHQQMEVISSANPVEPTETSRHEQLMAEDIRNIPSPVSHALRQSLPVLPGVVADNQGQLHIAGGRSNDTEYLLDGFDISDPIHGDLSANLNVDAVRSLDLQPAMSGAQFSHAAAGALALHTQMGDDRWRFGTTNFLPGPVFYQGLHLGNWYPRFTASGPIRRGRAWFSDALSIQHTLNLVRELPRGANAAPVWAADNLLRTQINLTPRQTLQGDFLYNYQNSQHVGLGVFSPLATTRDQNLGRVFVSERDQIAVGSSLLELGAAAESEHNGLSPLGQQLYVLNPVGASGNYFESLRQRAHRWQAVGDWLFPSLPWQGTHDVQIGFNLDWLGLRNSATRQPFEIVDANEELLQRTSFSGAPAYALASRRDGAFVQDDWRLGSHLRLRPGLRLDHDSLLGQSLIAPRLAASVFPWSDGRAKLSVGWGVYAQPADLALYGQAFDRQRTDVFFASGATSAAQSTRFALPTGRLELPRFIVTNLNWEQRVRGHTFIGLHLLRRQESDGLAYDYLAFDPAAAQATLQLGNTRRDRYRSWELSLRRSFRGRAEFFADYTHSRATSNQVFDYNLDSAVFTPQAAGPLAWDAPHRVISWGWLPVPLWHTLLLSYHFEYRSGFPFNVIDNRHRVVGAPNRLRFPDFLTLDFGVEKKFRFRNHQWAVRISLINATGRQNPNAVFNNIDAPNFLAFAGGQGRAITARLRLVGRH